MLQLESRTGSPKPGVRPPMRGTGYYYSKAAVLDAYEVLRQFIDATDELRGGLANGVLPAVELLTDRPRGLPAYTGFPLADRR